MSGRTPSAPRCAAIVGSYLRRKTTLLESLLFACGAIHRKGTVKDGNTVGDASPEARARDMSVEVMRKGGAPRSSSLVIADGASLVWSVENTK